MLYILATYGLFGVIKKLIFIAKVRRGADIAYHLC